MRLPRVTRNTICLDPSLRLALLAPAALAVSVASAYFLVPTTATADGRWRDLTPVVRGDHSAVYDPIVDRLILFGGVNPIDLDEVYGDVWELTLSGAGAPRWRRLEPFGPAPTPRYGHTAIYDAPRRRMIVFGGYDGVTDFDEVWSLSLHGDPSWTQLAPAGAAPPGFHHSAVYDANSDRMIIFGGHFLGLTKDDVLELSLGLVPGWTGVVPAGDPAAAPCITPRPTTPCGIG